MGNHMSLQHQKSNSSSIKRFIGQQGRKTGNSLRGAQSSTYNIYIVILLHQIDDNKKGN